MLPTPPRSPLFPYTTLFRSHALGADVAVVTQGPGNLGTGTTWGFSGAAVGDAVNATAALDGRPVAARRIADRSEELTSELQLQSNLVCRLLLEKKNKQTVRS